MTAPRARLCEVAVTDLGIIEHLSLVIGPGMTALTGETGAGKTLVVGAIDLLLGGRADPGMVRAGAIEAVVEGRFEVDGVELVLTRVIPAEGRSRAYVDGRMATAAALGDQAGSLVDLHGQHVHQSLLTPSVQRAALDEFGNVDLTALRAARTRRADLEAQLADLGGDAGARAREADLLRYQLGELDAASIAGPAEDDELDALEDRLAGAVAYQEAASAAAAALSNDGGAVDGIGVAIAALDGQAPFVDLVERLRAAQAEVADLGGDVRAVGEGIEDDPALLEAVRERRHLLVELRRKYGTAPRGDGTSGSGTLADVLAYQIDAADQLDQIERHDERASELDASIAAARADEQRAAAVVGAARRRAAGPLGQAVQARLRELAMAAATVQVTVGGEDPGDRVEVLLSANPGTPAAPLAKVASGGELARSMLALRLVVREAPPVLVFDEVDAGIGGQAALAVGRALAALGSDHQVLVVTHLPQVAAFADHQVRIAKDARGGRTRSSVHPLDEVERVVEISRMLAGTPESERVQDAAAELLARAAQERVRP